MPYRVDGDAVRSELAVTGGHVFNKGFTSKCQENQGRQSMASAHVSSSLQRLEKEVPKNFNVLN